MYTFWYIQSYLRQYTFLRVGKVNRDIKIKHENQINHRLIRATLERACLHCKEVVGGKGKKYI